MPDWTAFAGLTGVVLTLLLALSRLTASALTGSNGDDGSSSSDGSPSESGAAVDETGPADRPGSTLVDSDSSRAERSDSDPARNDPTDVAPVDGDSTGIERSDADATGAESTADTIEDGLRDGEPDADSVGSADRPGGDAFAAPRGNEPRVTADSLSTGEVLANVAFSQGLFAAVLIAAAVYTEIPPEALGIAVDRSALVDGLWIGTAFGLVLYGANELGSLTAKRLGIDHDEELRALLAPDSTAGWLVLLAVVLPTIAVFEEFLFRAALVGAISTGFAVSPWLMAAVSSIAFAVGHGVQGPTGVVVTGVLGFVLAAAFIVTGSLLVVVVAHYVVNALEFVVHEGLGFEWGTTDT